MAPQIDSITIGAPTSEAAAALNTIKDSIVQFTGKAHGPNYPRLISHTNIMIRTLAIADNLDEIMTLPKNMLIPLLSNKQKPNMRTKKVRKTEKKDGASLGKRRKSQEEEFEDYDENE